MNKAGFDSNIIKLCLTNYSPGAKGKKKAVR